MSGRDFRTFLASHHSQIGQSDNRLVTRFLAGHKPLYKEVDYEKLSAITKLKKSSGEQSLKKVEQLFQKNDLSKESLLLSEHRFIWVKEGRRLRDEELKLEGEISLLKLPSLNLQLSVSSRNDKIYEDINEYEMILKEDLPDFIEQTVHPISHLREDIEHYIEMNRDQLVMGVHNDVQNDDIKTVLQSVKQQQVVVMEKLEAEEIQAEDELKDSMHTLSLNDNSLPEIRIGVPNELMVLECPDESLKVSCLTEFNSLDEKYVARLESLENKYEDAIRRAPYAGWSEKDHFCFCHVMNQYIDVTKNQRKLYIDCLKRIFNKKSFKAITKHEEWWLSYKSFRREIKDLFHSWKRDRDDMALQVTSMFHEACSQYTEKQNKIVDHMKQKFVCNYLHEKLMQYQTERLELLKLEEAHCAAREKEIQEEINKKVLVERNKRERNKQKIKVYKEEKDKETTLLSERERVRMQELQEKRAIQRAYDLERVRYRDQRYQDKILSTMERKRLAREEELEKERRLQLLRDQVSVNVDADPERILQPTEAYKAHISINENEEKEIQEQLFKCYTYSVDQIAQDKRVKIENALRRANLHMTDYGRQILSSVPPPSVPRKELKSTVLRFDE